MDQEDQKAEQPSAEALEDERQEIEGRVIELVKALLPDTKSKVGSGMLASAALQEKAPEAGGVELSRATRLKELGFTSMDLTMLTFDVDEEWGLNLKDSYRDDYLTIGELCDLVLELRRKSSDGKAG
ncbi:hypothetical protein COCOR_06894 [Corallococcus coralloides DSM 2259]|uniref:Carrier domain-containing protein n=1 Tax=Corallococcus coralloides (strain ATCC 25202 / DSM 2259 / NBRC 100086 / M2) TaxID=1144275 RepID=H8N138_CORCM|nr:hypothetical protein [Corallococcus coralloides]AFE07203.1 hypothetical protein COCOR_06894 [Corallococcus coralloides DSM 2259]